MLYRAGKESIMRINSQKSIELGQQVYDEYGSWAAVLKAAKRRDGIYVLPPSHNRKAPAPDDDNAD